jgi:hypothetical protein
MLSALAQQLAAMVLEMPNQVTALHSTGTRIGSRITS